ncbi:hypothetical protein NRB20_69590 [Nocardia sp. RB20]|uniref:Uncharacterized protein n=1 Tax=Nocardia macrotermitis TaxID=2585198 RepID=A0A7K0DDF1_9NOCA|nr:hypothetical protein [Nocardia macrotermitis]
MWASSRRTGCPASIRLGRPRISRSVHRRECWGRTRRPVAPHRSRRSVRSVHLPLDRCRDVPYWFLGSVRWVCSSSGCCRTVLHWFPGSVRSVCSSPDCCRDVSRPVWIWLGRLRIRWSVRRLDGNCPRVVRTGGARRARHPDVMSGRRRGGRELVVSAHCPGVGERRDRCPAAGPDSPESDPPMVNLIGLQQLSSSEESRKAEAPHSVEAPGCRVHDCPGSARRPGCVGRPHHADPLNRRVHGCRGFDLRLDCVGRRAPDHHRPRRFGQRGRGGSGRGGWVRCGGGVGWGRIRGTRTTDVARRRGSPAAASYRRSGRTRATLRSVDPVRSRQA